jgi:hypothetical protein
MVSHPSPGAILTQSEKGLSAAAWALLASGRAVFVSDLDHHEASGRSPQSRKC